MINQPLLDFIKGQLAKGLTKEKITSDLLANGWTAQDVAEGFAAITPPATSIPPIHITPPAAPIPNVSTAIPGLISPKTESFIPPSYMNVNANLVNTPVQEKIQAAKTHSGSKIFFIVLILFLLAGGASAYYFKDNLINLPIVKKFIPNKAAVAVVVPTDNTNQTQALPVQNNAAVAIPQVQSSTATLNNSVVTQQTQTKPNQITKTETMTKTALIHAKSGGTIILADGSSITVPPGMLKNDETMTLSLVNKFPSSIPNKDIVSVGNILILKFITPAEFNGTNVPATSTSGLKFVINMGSNNVGVQSSEPTSWTVNNLGKGVFFGADGAYNASLNETVMYVGADILGISSPVSEVDAGSTNL